MEQYYGYMDNGVAKSECRRLFSAVGWCFFVYMLLAQGLSYALATLYQNAGASWPISEEWSLWLVSYIPTYLIAFPIFLLLMKRIPDAPPPQRKKVRVRQALALLAVCFGTMYIANYLTLAVIAVLELVSGLTLANPLTTVAGANLPTLFFGVIFAPVMEEITFRGLLLGKLRGCGERLAMIASAFIFALFHGNLSQMLYAFVLGLIFAYVALRTGGIRVTILLHMIINLLGTVLAPLAMTNEILTIVLVVFVMAMIALSIVILLRRRHSIILDDGELPLTEDEKRSCFFGSAGIIAYGLLIIAVVVLYTLMTK